MLKYEKVNKLFPGEVHAVKDLELEVGAGQVYSLLGANGAGKTTTIMMTMGFIDISSGAISVNGDDVSGNPLEAKRHLAYDSENVTLYGSFNAIQNIEFFCRLNGQ